jgi:hypothetical protein
MTTAAFTRLVQTRLGVLPDAEPGAITLAALDKALPPHAEQPQPDSTATAPLKFRCIASSFADPADIRAFERCKAQGKSDLACFAVGDNGIGQFGKITAQEHTPMIAVHRNAMVAKWGTVAGAAHKAVRVSANGRIIRATVEDRISAPGRIDLNPACAKLLGLNPPFTVPCSWEWDFTA